MRTHHFKPDGRDQKRLAAAGFTLVEMMFACAIFSVLFIALLSAQMVGMRLDQLVESKSGASDSSRRALSQLPKDVRSAKMWAIGRWTNSVFIPDTSGAIQDTALQLCSTTNGSVFTIYFFDLTDAANSNGKLLRTDNTGQNPIVLASNLINTLYFTAETYNGVVQTNDNNGFAYKNVIHTTLQFCQFQYPLTQVGTNGLYDYYRLDFKATPHLPE